MHTTTKANPILRHISTPRELTTIQELRTQRLHQDLRRYLALNYTKLHSPLLHTHGRTLWPQSLFSVLMITIARCEACHDIPDHLLERGLKVQRRLTCYIRNHPTVLRELSTALRAVGCRFDWTQYRPIRSLPGPHPQCSRDL